MAIRAGPNGAKVGPTGTAVWGSRSGRRRDERNVGVAIGAVIRLKLAEIAGPGVAAPVVEQGRVYGLHGWDHGLPGGHVARRGVDRAPIRRGAGAPGEVEVHAIEFPPQPDNRSIRHDGSQRSGKWRGWRGSESDPCRLDRSGSTPEDQGPPSGDGAETRRWAGRNRTARTAVAEHRIALELGRHPSLRGNGLDPRDRVLEAVEPQQGRGGWGRAADDGGVDDPLFATPPSGWSKAPETTACVPER